MGRGTSLRYLPPLGKSPVSLGTGNESGDLWHGMVSHNSQDCKWLLKHPVSPKGVLSEY